jgi:hypothetical protein
MTDYVRKRLGDVFIDTFFQFSVTLGGVAFVTGLETLNATIPIQSDANFLCVHTMMDNGSVATGLAAAPNLPAFANGGIVVTITDGATQRALSNIPIPATALFGSAQRPYMWPLTHLFRANTPITIQATGQGIGPPTVIGVTFRLVFGGFKVPVGSLPGTNL